MDSESDKPAKPRCVNRYGIDEESVPVTTDFEQCSRNKSTEREDEENTSLIAICLCQEPSLTLPLL